MTSVHAHATSVGARTETIDEQDEGVDGSVARAVGLSKVYGAGDAAVVALDDVTV